MSGHTDPTGPDPLARHEFIRPRPTIQIRNRLVMPDQNLQPASAESQYPRHGGRTSPTPIFSLAITIQFQPADTFIITYRPNKRARLVSDSDPTSIGFDPRPDLRTHFVNFNNTPANVPRPGQIAPLYPRHSIRQISQKKLIIQTVDSHGCNRLCQSQAPAILTIRVHAEMA